MTKTLGHRLRQQIAAVFSMSDAVWQRHTNPWSVWTRNTVLPLLVFALWTRVWLGTWAIFAIAAALFWMWLNPRLFEPPQSTDNWASKAVLGERVLLNQDEIPIPPHHQKMATILNLVALLGVPFLIWGIVTLQIWPTLFGSGLIYAGKLWFLDRMVWLYEDMKQASPTYQSWLY